MDDSIRTVREGRLHGLNGAPVYDVVAILVGWAFFVVNARLGGSEFWLLVLPMTYSIILPLESLPVLMLVSTSLIAWNIKRWRRYVLYSPTLYITWVRGFLMLATCIAILAVDFAPFPLGRAKTHDYGFSLMDMGVGAIVLSDGLAIGSKEGKQSLTVYGRVMKKTIPLWILGLIRLALVTGLNYQNPPEEYGLHWNFFFTLGCLPPILLVLTRIPPFISYLLVAIGHQVGLLWYLGAEDFVLSDERGPGLWSANKEAWVGLPGYVALELAGIALAQFARGRPSKPTTREKVTDPDTFSWRVLFPPDVIKCLLKLLAFAVPHFIVWVLLEPIYGVRPSRRLVNAPYLCLIVWIISLCCVGTYLIQVFTTVPMEKLTKKQLKMREKDNENPNLILESIASNRVSTFLLANILTGGCNLVMNPHEVESTFKYLGAISMYAAVLSLAAVTLRRAGIRL